MSSRYRIYAFDGYGGLKIFTSMRYGVKKLHTDIEEARDALKRVQQREGQYLLVDLDEHKIIGFAPMKDVIQRVVIKCDEPNG